MKKRIFALFIMLICICTIHSVTIFASQKEVIKNDETGIPDPELYKCILQHLRKGEGETFTRKEAAKIDKLEYTSYSKVKSLKGIGYLKNLEILELDNSHELKSLKGIEELKKLKSLRMQDGVPAHDFWRLEGIHTLEGLDITNNNLTDLKGIEKLTQLQYLEAYDNKLKDVNELKHLKNLSYLLLDGNRLININALKNLTNLQEVDLSNNRLKSLKGVGNLKNLERLYVQGNRLTDVDEVMQLKKLWFLDISRNRLRRLPELKKLKKLIVCIEGNYLTEKEIKKKVSYKIYEENRKKVQKDDINSQLLNAQIKLSSPSSVKKITEGTTEISGKVTRIPSYEKATYVKLVNWSNETYNEINWKTDEKGRFKLENLDLQGWAGNKVYLRVMIYSYQRREWYTANEISFTVKP